MSTQQLVVADLPLENTSQDFREAFNPVKDIGNPWMTRRNDGVLRAPPLDERCTVKLAHAHDELRYRMTAESLICLDVSVKPFFFCGTSRAL